MEGRILFVATLVLMTAVFSMVRGNHFKGGHLTWRHIPNKPRTVAFTLKLTWFLNAAAYPCDDSIIQSGVLVTPDDEVTCISANCNSLTNKRIGSSKIRCTDFDRRPNGTWMAGETEFNYTFPQVDVYVVGFKGFAWINAAGAGGNDWVVRTKVDLAIRPDTGRVNTPPKVLGPTILAVNHACKIKKRVKIQVTDVDGDTTNCRWGSGIAEVGTVWNSRPPGTFLDSKTCELHIDPVQMAKNVSYVIAVIVEDYRVGSHLPLSEVSIQFVVETISRPGCSKPTFMAPTPTQSITIHFDVTCGKKKKLSFDAQARANTLNYSIQDILLSGRQGLMKGKLTNYSISVSAVRFEWAPKAADVGLWSVCLIAVDHTGVQSDPRCFQIHIYANSSVLPNLCAGIQYCTYCGPPVSTTTKGPLTTIGLPSPPPRFSPGSTMVPSGGSASGNVLSTAPPSGSGNPGGPANQKPQLADAQLEWRYWVVLGFSLFLVASLMFLAGAFFWRRKQFLKIENEPDNETFGDGVFRFLK